MYITLTRSRLKVLQKQTSKNKLTNVLIISNVFIHGEIPGEDQLREICNLALSSIAPVFNDTHYDRFECISIVQGRRNTKADCTTFKCKQKSQEVTVRTWEPRKLGLVRLYTCFPELVLCGAAVPESFGVWHKDVNLPHAASSISTQIAVPVENL